MNILIYGSKGWIGGMFIELLNKDFNNIKYHIGSARADNIKEVMSELDNIKPTHVISFIGRTHGPGYSTIDYLEQEGKLVENIRDNLFSPFILAQLCNQYNIHYTYLGTGCIFKYDDNINTFNEDDMPNFFGSSYSIVKGYTDSMMKMYKNVLNLRIRMPITNTMNPRNFITKITNYKKICSMPNSMTVLPTLLPYIVDMMKNNITGTINLTNPGVISHNEILELYKEIVDNNIKWENFTEEEQRRILLSDRSNNHLDTTKLSNMYPDVKHIKDAVIECLIEYKKTNNRL
jgi:dTDP-4-dehydrorhamnose reductase